MKTVFIVDDNETTRVKVKSVLSSNYSVYAIPSAQRMFGILEKVMPDLILLDIDMPEIDGFAALKALKSNPEYKNIPVIFLTANAETSKEIQGFELGAVDFIGKPFSPAVLIRRVESHLINYMLIRQSTIATNALHNATISVIADVVECRDKITGKHIERTQSYLKILVDELMRTGVYRNEISKWDMSLLLPSAQLHDVGKIVISDTILNKQGRFTPREFDIIKTHSKVGENIIDEIINKIEDDDYFLIHAKRFAGSHHEKWNGGGYPRGLKGKEICLEGRIMAIVDVYDALVSERPYKKALTHGEAVEIIKRESGVHFDPKIVRAFLSVEADIKKESIRLRNDKSKSYDFEQTQGQMEGQEGKYAKQS